MTYNLLTESISRHISLSEEEKELLISIIHSKKLKKRHFLLQEGEISKNTTFVISGILRIYSIDKNGFEHILQFAPPGWWIGDMRSFLNQQPGALYIDAIEDSEILYFSRQELELLYQIIPKFERYFRILAENAIATYQDRLSNNLSLPAIDRYNNFCRLYPSLIQSLPQKYVAAYIGVTPEFLSKMLKTQATNK
jgi:CRP/FNR family transcriptional regulator, anaerobic regulatory protein